MKTIKHLIALSFCLPVLAAQPVLAVETITHEHQVQATSLKVYKSPTCSCCEKWIEHIEGAGYAALTVHQANMGKTKEELGIPVSMRSCHTAVSAEGYVFEGHIPADIITRFLSDPVTDSIGLAVPGMPMGSPGMEMGDHHQPYDVMVIKKDGSAEVYESVK